jgi:CRISPR/Cas system endoribonuclease Cas6 (RAMP superfamily)
MLARMLRNFSYFTFDAIVEFLHNVNPCLAEHFHKVFNAKPFTLFNLSFLPYPRHVYLAQVATNKFS